MNSFSRTVDLLHRSLDANTMRYEISAHNLANAEVPNFKRSELNFESQLKKALDSEKEKDNHASLLTSDPRHIKNDTYIDYQTVLPRKVSDYFSTVKPNGNNVDAEQEAMNILKVQLNYQLLARLQDFQFAQMKIALK